MKGKRVTTEDKLRILRDADRGKGIPGGVPGAQHFPRGGVSIAGSARTGRGTCSEARQQGAGACAHSEPKEDARRGVGPSTGSGRPPPRKDGEPGTSSGGGPRGGAGRAAAHAVGPGGRCAAFCCWRAPRFSAVGGHPRRASGGGWADGCACSVKPIPGMGLPEQRCPLGAREGWAIGKRQVQRRRRADGLCACRPRAVGPCARASPPGCPPGPFVVDTSGPGTL